MTPQKCRRMEPDRSPFKEKSNDNIQAAIIVDDFLNGRTWKVLLILLSSIAGCLHQNTETPVFEEYFRGDFTVIGEPILNAEVEVTFTVNPVTESFNTKIHIFLQEGIELSEGSTYWEGDLVENERVHITMRVKPVKEEQHEIRAYSMNSFYKNLSHLYIPVTIQITPAE